MPVLREVGNCCGALSVTRDVCRTPERIVNKRVRDNGAMSQFPSCGSYDDLHQRTAVREALAKDTARAQIPSGREFVVAQEAEIMTPAPFMHPLGSRDYGTGNVYEMRTYTYAPGDISQVLEAWATAIPDREKFSPLAACWSSELGGLNKF